jgi:hypothetical protein
VFVVVVLVVGLAAAVATVLYAAGVGGSEGTKRILRDEPLRLSNTAIEKRSRTKLKAV